jgi:SPP1 gp7 family putative phage head morphogenesis protein
MRLFGYDIKRTKGAEITAETQVRKNTPQGPLSPWFTDLILRKVSGDFYEALREGIPVIDSGIRRLISLNGTVKIIGDNPDLVKELEDFARYVPVNDYQKGLQAFVENKWNEVFEQGFGISEFIATPDHKDIAGLRVADSKDINFRRNAEGGIDVWYKTLSSTPIPTIVRPESIANNILNATYSQNIFIHGGYEKKLRRDNLLYMSINNENQDPYGVSLLRSMEFVAKILTTIQNSTANVWERFGDPSYHINYKTSKKDFGGDTLEERRTKLQTSFDGAIRAKRLGKSADFVTALDTNSSIEISIIGENLKPIKLDMPARHVLEQIVSKLGLPAWMLGLYWSTTERMATLEVEAALQDAKMRHFVMYPELIKLLSAVLAIRGKKWKTITTDPNTPGDWGVCFEIPNLRDQVAEAQARFLNGQADMMSSQASVNISTGQAAVEIDGMTFPIASPRIKAAHRGPCKEISRPVIWPELDKVEADYEKEISYEWDQFAKSVYKILDLEYPGKATKGVEDEIPFKISAAQKKSIESALSDDFLIILNPSNPESSVIWAYGKAYDLGLIDAAHSVGGDKPLLDLIKNQEILAELQDNGFKLLKDKATKRVLKDILPALDEFVTAGKNPKEVAAGLRDLFGEANTDWERLARSEMSMAAEKAKLAEWTEYGLKKIEFVPSPDACTLCDGLAGVYEIKDAPVPVEDTHPRCRCASRPAGKEA